MKNGLKKIFVITLITAGLLLPALSGVFAQSTDCKTQTTKPTTASPYLLSGLGEACFKCGNCTLCDMIGLIIGITNLIVYLSGVLAVIGFIWAGFIMITSYGNEARIKWAKEMMVAVVIGLFIVLLAWVIVNTIMTILAGGSANKNEIQLSDGAGEAQPFQITGWSTTCSNLNKIPEVKQ
ncbi:MAG: pilin [bacterium]